MKKILFILAITTGLLLSSCQKFEEAIENNQDTTVPTDPAAIKSMDDLTISESFDWNMTKTLDIEISLPENDKSRILYIYSEDGKKLFFKGHTSDGTSILKTKITVPTYENGIQLKYGSGSDYDSETTYIGSSTVVYLINQNLKMARNDDDDDDDDDGDDGDDDDDDGDDDDDDGDDDDNNDCDTDGNDNISTFAGFEFEFDEMTENMNGTSIWTYTITGNGASKDLSHWVLALCDGHNVVSASYDGYWEVNTDPTTEVYGIKWDKEINKNDGTRTFSFVLDDHYDIETVAIAFKAGTQTYECTINGPSCDPDPDPDPEDFIGTLAYEDLWPGKGDYDINDLVIEYDFDVTKDNNEFIETVVVSFKIRAFGAELHNGFGFTFPNVSPNDIVSVSGYDIAATNVFDLALNGVENGQSKATFIVYDDTYRLMAHPGSGIGVNTDHPAPYVTPEIVTLTIEFANEQITFTELDLGNFNPFIIVNQTRGMEVHLPNYVPTDKHDPAYFGTFADNTNPSIDRYYLTQDNLPWGIHIPETFDYPEEKQVILGAHLHFAEWAQSNGVNYPDWYKDLPGYRNASVIY